MRSFAAPGLLVSNADRPSQTETPNLKYTAEFVDMLAEVAGLVNVQWYLGPSVPP